MKKSFLKRMLPQSLFGRSLMIIVTPLILLQVIAGGIFYESHWYKVSLRLSRDVAGDIAAVVDLMHQNPGPENRAWIFDLASDNLAMTVNYTDDMIISPSRPAALGKMEESLHRALSEAVARPFRIDTDSIDRHIIIDVQLPEGVLRVVINRKRLFSSTTYVLVLWMVGTSLILFAVATLFMRNQVKPIRRLAEAADDFGKGRDVPAFKLEGASEVRQAAAAFVAMRDRIQRQISQRTDMLAGVSHDLRTPLTRMKLQLEMASGGASGNAGLEDLKSDIAEMEHMLEGYLAFARGEGDEEPRPVNLSDLMTGVVQQARRKGGVIDLHVESDIQVPLRPNAFRRALTNLVENATRYGEHVSVRAGRREDAIEVIVDDDGPGIAAEFREDVFKPFFRIEGSRNPGTGGVGLGLSIARDVIRAHGGDIELNDNPGGGLRVRIRLPV